MKPITHPLAIAALHATAIWHRERSLGSVRGSNDVTQAWLAAGCPLYSDPTPMPAPALGMRVWTSADGGNDRRIQMPPFEIRHWYPGVVWDEYTLNTGIIDLITDFRTGEVLWRRE